MNALLANKGIIVASALVVLFVGERLFPASRLRHGVAGLMKNFSLAAVNLVLGPLLVLPLSAFAAQHALGLRPGWWNIALDLVLMDGWIYGWHRINHVVPLFWRFHEVHHLDETLDTSTALRFHFGEVALSAVARAGLVWLVSIPFATVLVFETFVVVATVFHHSNLRLPQSLERALALVIVTPSIHWVHHHAQRADTDSNYATVLSIWDRLFGTRSATLRQPSMPIGVEGENDLGILQLILRPLVGR